MIRILITIVNLICGSIMIWTHIDNLKAKRRKEKERQEMEKELPKQIDVWRKIRKTWGSIDPRTRRKESKKSYDRNKSKIKLRKEIHDE